MEWQTEAEQAQGDVAVESVATHLRRIQGHRAPPLANARTDGIPRQVALAAVTVLRPMVRCCTATLAATAARRLQKPVKRLPQWADELWMPMPREEADLPPFSVPGSM
jgi:hypothetical protein